MKTGTGARTITFICSLMAIMVLAGCATNPISYASAPLHVQQNLIEIPLSNDQVTGVAVSQQGRIFVNFPRWDKDPLFSVAELKPDGLLRPYPDNDWNRWGKDEVNHPEAHFICVQSVYIDADDHLWVLDPASPGFKGVISGGPKLVQINLKTDTIERVIPFDDTIAPKASYLNDVRIDNAGEFAYISDSGTGAIIVVNLSNGAMQRRLAVHPSTKAETGYVLVINGRELRDENGQVPQIHADGIALDKSGQYLYYHALTARTLYRIKTSMLKNFSVPEDQLAGYVEKVADTGAVDGMLMDDDDNLYLTALENDSIQRYRTDGDILDTIVEGSIPWPDSMAASTDNFLYITASQINRMPRFNYGQDKRILPYKLYKIGLIPD